MTEPKTDLQKDILDKFAQAEFGCKWEFAQNGWMTIPRTEELVALALEMKGKDMIAKFERTFHRENWVKHGLIRKNDWEKFKKEQGQGV